MTLGYLRIATTALLNTVRQSPSRGEQIQQGRRSGDWKGIKGYINIEKAY
jgi:hypothetical protein